MSVDQIRGALETIDARPRDGFLGELEDQLVAAWTDDTGLDVHDVPVDAGEAAPHPLHWGRRWLLAAAATIAVLALGLLVVTAVDEPDSIQTDTVPPTPVPSTTPATTSPPPTLPATAPPPAGTAPLPADSSPATLPANTQLSAPPPGEEITVTADLVEFGDGLVGLIGNMDRAEGRTYVIAGRYQTEADLLRAPEEAVLAAFDDDGRELWRTELDGTPVEVVAGAGDVWALHEFGMTGALSRIDAASGRVVGHVGFGNATGLAGAFGSMWVQIGDLTHSAQLIRVDPDMSTTTVELPDRIFGVDVDPWPDGVAAGPDAIWVPLGGAGVAVIAPDTLDVTVISRDEIGHDVMKVAFDGDVTYVASRSQVTSIVDGHIEATAVLGLIHYLGPIDGAFGAQLQKLDNRQFAVLRPNDPMVVADRRISTSAIASEIAGEAWVETGRNYNLRRVELLPSSDADE